MSNNDINWTDKKCKSTVYLTPPKILNPVRNYFGGRIPLDPATSGDNPTDAVKFYTEKDDGLIQPWDAPVFVNPPYGTSLRDGFCPRIGHYAAKGLEIIALLPCGARFGCPYWQLHILNEHLTARCYIMGRVSFLRPDGSKAKGNPYDSILYGYNVDTTRFVRSFKHLGLIETIGRRYVSAQVESRFDKEKARATRHRHGK